MKMNLQKTVNQKKGQITASVIFGLVIAAIIAFTFYLSSELNREEPQEHVIISNTAEGVKQYVDDCLKTVAEDGLVEMGAHGGYISPKDYLTVRSFNIGYVYSNGKKTFQDIGVWEKELSAYIENNLRKKCKFSMFEDLNISESARVEAEVSFKNEAMIHASWLVTVNKDDKVFNFKEHKIKLHVKMDKIWEIMDKIIKNPGQAEAEGYIRDLENVTIVRYGYKEGLQSVYMIRDYNSKMENKDYYIFAFATK